MSTLITGASGFLGGRLAQLLAGEGEEVAVLARASSDLSHLQGMCCRVVAGDLTDRDSLTAALAGVKRVLHCAACSTDWATPATYQAANVTGTENLLAAALECPTLQRLVHISTTDVYGYPAVPCDESTPTRDAGLPYNQTKRLGEMAVWRAHREHGLPVTILRPATIYGPRGKDFTVEIANLLRQRLMATIDQGRARGGFAYVDNVAHAILAASTHPATVGEVFNIADGTNATWADYLALFCDALALKMPWIDLSGGTATRLAGGFELVQRMLKLRGRPLLTRHAVLLLAVDQEFPVGKAQRVFGFDPAVSLGEGVARSAAWFRDRDRG